MLLPINASIKDLVQIKLLLFTKCLQFSITMIKLKNFYFLITILILNYNVYPVFSQLSGREKTMEQFLDRLLHESVYDKRIRPFYTDNKSKIKRIFNFFSSIIKLHFFNTL